jgi:hypothetical protein
MVAPIPRYVNEVKPIVRLRPALIGKALVLQVKVEQWECDPIPVAPGASLVKISKVKEYWRDAIKGDWIDPYSRWVEQ